MKTSLFFKSYEEVVDWLFVQLPNYQAKGGAAYKPGLDTINTLLRTLGNPHDDFRSVHIAGTNGKGSTAHMLSSVYQENGYKVGIFTSPHIVDFRERIKINGEMISKEFVFDFVNEFKDTIDKLGASFFEITTAMAFYAFAKEELDLAIVETGLGGRLDSTNVLSPELSIITNIGIDHTQFLGETLAEIAVEKAGIIKKNTPVLIGRLQEETQKVFVEKSNDLGASLTYAVDAQLSSDLMGKYQKENASTVSSAIQILEEKFPTDSLKVKFGLKRVAINTKFMGRFQKIQDSPIVILDAAHNPSGIKNLLEEIKQFGYDKLHIVYGSSNDKDVATVFKILPKNASYYFTTFNSSRSLSIEDFQVFSDANKLQSIYFNSSIKALKRSKVEACEFDLILVCGSFFVLEEILKGELLND